MTQHDWELLVGVTDGQRPDRAAVLERILKRRGPRDVLVSNVLAVGLRLVVDYLVAVEQSSGDAATGALGRLALARQDDIDAIVASIRHDDTFRAM